MIFLFYLSLVVRWLPTMRFYYLCYLRNEAYPKNSKLYEDKLFLGTPPEPIQFGRMKISKDGYIHKNLNQRIRLFRKIH